MAKIMSLGLSPFAVHSEVAMFFLAFIVGVVTGSLAYALFRKGMQKSFVEEYQKVLVTMENPGHVFLFSLVVSILAMVSVRAFLFSSGPGLRFDSGMALLLFILEICCSLLISLSVSILIADVRLLNPHMSTSVRH